jgi:hypothetical protein
MTEEAIVRTFKRAEAGALELARKLEAAQRENARLRARLALVHLLRELGVILGWAGLVWAAVAWAVVVLTRWP